MTQMLLTGFPGFLGSALLPRILARREGVRASCLVQDRHLDAARTRLAEIVAEHPELEGRVELVVGDITQAGLGLSDAAQEHLREVSEVWHLAAIYDLTVPESVAHRVNVTGTANVLDFCRAHPELSRLQYVSTCYVSGTYAGRYREDDLDVGQGFYNHYESTKFAAEKLVRAAIADGLPATIYRPGMVVGDSTTGVTQKFDGPYMAAAFMRRQPMIAILPRVGDPDEVLASLVPRDYVIAGIDALSVLPASIGRTYALTDPTPPTAREFAGTVAAHYGKRVVWVPAPLGLVKLAVSKVPGLESLLGLPAEVLDYFATATTYDTTNAVTDLAGTGVACPKFADYADRLLDFMAEHPEIGTAAMV